MKDLYATVTDKIIEDLSKGVRPWMKPWEAGNAALPMRFNGSRYRGVNVLLLWSEAVKKGYKSSTWMTYKQAIEIGSNVKKGEHGSMVVFASSYVKTEEKNGKDVERSASFLKSYTVFNVEQIENLPEKYKIKPVEPRGPVELIEASETFFAATGAVFKHGGAQAFYTPKGDYIQLPAPETFNGPESYAATKAHELIHWTGDSKRCDRKFGVKFGDDQYAREELVAELGAAFLCAMLGVTPEPREDHASYLASWLKVLKADKRAIFQAAAAAQKACDWLTGAEE